LHLLVKGLTDGHVYLNSLMSGSRNWQGWIECPPGGLITPYPLATALHNNTFYVFAVSEAGTVLHKPLNTGQSQPGIEPWQEVPGNMMTDAAVAATAADGRLVLCAKGKDQQIYLNELSPGGRSWGGWYGLPGGGTTQVSPALATFQDELYVIISEPVSARIRTKVRSVNGRYTAWSEIPGPGLTLSPITASSPGGQLHLFARGVDNAPYFNIASETGTWSHWHIMPNPGTTDASLATATVGGRVYLFAKGIIDRRLYVRQTRFPIRPD
jgi:hypothetical protein